MKILAVSDEVVDWIYSPALLQRCGNMDLIISCGDLPIYYLEFISSLLNAPCYMVHGNHDQGEIGFGGELKSVAAGWRNLDMQCVREGKIMLGGLQGCLRYKLDSPYQYEQSHQQARAYVLAARALWNRALRGAKLDILVTHAPPYGIHDAADRAHTGFTAINWLIDTFAPRLVLHGHQHRNYAPTQSFETMIGHTCVLNVHPYQIIEL
jgi:Icc-related predicted phosphoesterase